MLNMFFILSHVEYSIFSYY